MHHVLEFVPYQRVRPASEYTTGPFRESRMTAIRTVWASSGSIADRVLMAPMVVHYLG